MRLQVIALKLQHFTHTETNIVPIQGTNRVIASGRWRRWRA